METFVLVPERDFKRLQKTEPDFDENISALLSKKYSSAAAKAITIRDALTAFQNANLPKQNESAKPSSKDDYTETDIPPRSQTLDREESVEIPITVMRRKSPPKKLAVEKVTETITAVDTPKLKRPEDIGLSPRPTRPTSRRKDSLRLNPKKTKPFTGGRKQIGKGRLSLW